MARIVVAGVARNCAASFCEEMATIRRALKHHDIARVVVVESDSTDGSAQFLEEWSCQAEENTYFSLGELQGVYPRRTERLAYCRNVYMKFLERNDFFGADYLYITDMDGVNTHLNSGIFDGVISTLRQMPGSAATANQLYKYYDIWALRHPTWSPNDCWESFHQLSPALGPVQAHSVCNESRMVHIDTGLPPIEVDSAFGGGGVYDTAVLAGCRYKGVANNAETCEHVSFSHDYRQNGGRIFVFPAFINHDKSEHVLNAEKFSQTLQSASMVSDD